ncbi:MAG TPA: glycosyltransferase family 4 protein [Candidatus Saccharimonadales bacterium]|nr:glycosyltransferase family 4 protein [Candidatus Saccharimonadales bacterium]
MNKLKIAFVIDDGMDRPDGVQQYVLTLGRWFKRQGHSVRYLTGETSRQDIKDVIPLARNLSVRFNGNSLTTPLRASGSKIKKVLDEERFDIIHVQIPHSPFMAARVVRRAHKNSIVIGTFHVLPTGRLQRAGTKLLGLVLKYNLKKFDMFLSVSKPAKRFAKKAFGINSTVLPNPVETTRFKKNTKTRDNKSVSILFLGRLVPRKGCMQLIKAVEILLQADLAADIKLDICGSGNQKNAVEKYIQARDDLKKITVMHGFVSEKKKAELLANADFAVFPSLSGESFGIVLIEAMAAETGAVLAGNNPGYSSVLSSVPDSLFDPKNPRELSDKLLELIKSKKKFDSMHNRQQSLVKKFDVERIGTKLLDIYTAKA